MACTKGTFFGLAMEGCSFLTPCLLTIHSKVIASFVQISHSIRFSCALAQVAKSVCLCSCSLRVVQPCGALRVVETKKS